MNEQRLPAPMAEFSRQFMSREEMMRRALPPNVTWERFQSTVIQAVMHNRKLLDCNRASLIQSCFKAANDGLVLDGREAALVEFYDGKQGRSVQYLPMIGGIRRLARQSGVVRNWEVFAVGINDGFRYTLGDYPAIDHEPSLDDPGELRAVYSIVTLRSGGDTDISREVMSRTACERIRNRSSAYQAFMAGKIKSTPWNDSFEEMCKKTVAKRHAKRLPLSRELIETIDRDDPLYRTPEEIEDETPRRRRKAPPSPSADDGEDPGLEATELDATDDDGDDTLGQTIDDVDPRVDFEAGAEAFRQGVKACKDTDVLANPDRLNRWRAGWASAADKPPAN
jgi:phage RecT family recombinase